MTGPQILQVVQGEYRVSDAPGIRLSTMLGSCVAACLWDDRRGVGGMNHFLLAQAQDSRGRGDIRYGVHAMEVLINALLRAGAQRGRLQAKLFGGAKIAANLRDIGASNAEFARRFLRTEGIPCRAESLGGTLARRVIFDPVTGQARQLLIPNADLDEAARAPRAAAPTRPQTDIVLF